MCIAIVKPKDKVLDKELLKTCYENNKDGMGFAYCEKGTVFIKKFMDFEDFYNEYKKVETTSNMLIHFRIATHGGVEVSNCHPFKLNNRMALIHNGVISGYGDKKTKPDTVDFIEKIIGNISYKQWWNESFRLLVGDAIGHSKLAILDKSGKYFIVNESLGDWVDGVWFSNSSYKNKKVYTNYTGNIKRTTTISTYGGYPEWDYTSNQTYDEWYKEYRKYVDSTKKLTPSPSSTKATDNEEDDEDCQLIYECKKCGGKFYTTEYDPTCSVCRATGDDIKEIGCRYQGVDYLYDEKYEVAEAM